MVKYNCENCQKSFSQRGHLKDHISKKRPCKKENTIEALVEQKVKEALLKTNEEMIKIDITRLQMDYSKKSREELIAICKEKSIKGYSGKKKDDIVKLLDISTEPVIIQSTSRTADLNKNSLIHGDCMQEMKTIPDASIDMILCDLPYGVTKNSWDVIIPFDTLWKEYKRIIKNNGAILLFGSQPFTSLMITSNLDMFRYSLVWEKNKFSDFLNSKRKPMKTNEDIVVFYKKQPTYNPQYWYSTPYTRWNTQSAVDKQTNYGNHKENIAESKDGKRLPTTVLKFDRIERPQHPTQKPVELLEWLIKTYTNENETVLDNCMGVGSTGVACKNINRNFIGIELEKKYFDIAVTRTSS
jgi:site-specific DNA-methyltransferase (adenine-specific)